MASEQQAQLASRPTWLSTEELSLRWHGLPTVGTLRNWRSLGLGPDYFVLMPFGARHAAYPLRAVQAFELAQTCIPRHRPWSGVFLTVEQLVERWRGTPDQVAESTLRTWRSPDYRARATRTDLRWLPWVNIHHRQILYPLEAVKQHEADRAWDRLHAERAKLVMPPVSPTYAEIWRAGPPVEP